MITLWTTPLSSTSSIRTGTSWTTTDKQREIFPGFFPTSNRRLCFTSTRKNINPDKFWKEDIKKVKTIYFSKQEFSDLVLGVPTWPSEKNYDNVLIEELDVLF